MGEVIVLHAQYPNLQWVRGMGGAPDDISEDIAIDGSGNSYITGGFSNSGDFDPGTGVHNLTSKGRSDIFISKLDANGNFVFAKGIGGVSSDGAGSIILDN